MRRNIGVRVGILAAVFVAIQAAAVFAQSASVITGTVRDSSGAVLPGVTVEATSPALIEKVRSVVTDGGGVYRIIELRPQQRPQQRQHQRHQGRPQQPQQVRSQPRMQRDEDAQPVHQVAAQPVPGYRPLTAHAPHGPQTPARTSAGFPALGGGKSRRG